MTECNRTVQLERACSYLRRIPAWYLATTDVDDGHQPRVRPFSFAMVDDGKLWFCTNNQKDVYKDMQANPNIEISVSSPAYAWIRLNGEAVFENKGDVHPEPHRQGAVRRGHQPHL